MVKVYFATAPSLLLARNRIAPIVNRFYRSLSVRALKLQLIQIIPPLSAFRPLWGTYLIWLKNASEWRTTMKPNIHLYRKRFIPNELISLHKDEIFYADENLILTRWDTLKPRADFSHGISGYFLKKNCKVTKVLNADNTLVYWYCDIMQMVEGTRTHDGERTLIMEDLLIDVLVYPDGSVRVLDLDEAADAAEQGLITQEMLCRSMRAANRLLQDIYTGKFKEYQQEIERKINKLPSSNT